MRALSEALTGFRNVRIAPWLASLAVAVGGVALIAGEGLLSVFAWWQEPEGSHGWLIPVVAGFTLWLRRSRIKDAGTAPTWWGFTLVMLGLALLLVDSVGQLQRVTLPSVIIIALGGILAARGWPAARLAVTPLALLLFAIPPPASLYIHLSLQLQFISSALGTEILRLLGMSVFLDGNVIDLGVYKMQVLEACNGLRYLFPLACFGFLCTWIFRAPLWAKVLVLLSTIPITVGMNAIRIAITGLLINYTSVEHAEGFMHLFEGWAIFLMALAVMIGFMGVLYRILGNRGAFRSMLDFDRLSGVHIGGPRTPTHPYARWRGIPVAWLACVALIALAVPAHAATMNRPQYVPTRVGLATLPLKLGEWRGSAGSIDMQTQLVLGSSDYFLADFARRGPHGIVNLWIVYYDQQVREAAIHTPRQCLPGAGWEFVTHETVVSSVRNSSGHPFRINRALAQNGQQQILLYYWLEARGEQFSSPQRFKFANVRDSLLYQRSDGGLVRLITTIDPRESVEAADTRLIDFMHAAYPAVESHFSR